MQFKIQVIDVEVVSKPTKKGTYKQLTVTYKNLDREDKIEAKKIMDFAQKDIFDILKEVEKGEFFVITTTKNEQSGFWDWVGVSQEDENKGNQMTMEAAVGTQVPQTKSYSASPKSTYETPEERALKQKYIIRQSSISSAIELIGINGVKEGRALDVIKLAEKFYNYVMNGYEDLSIDAMKDDTRILG